jgi:DNA-binding response OmpR family regulator
MRILIIEDEKSLREDVVDYLTENGYKCDFATTIKSAMQKLNDIVYSCALVDVGLPDGSGIEVVEYIKKNNPERRKSFRARHHCENPGPRWKPRYWACRSW